MSNAQPVSRSCRGEGKLVLPVPDPSEWYLLEVQIRPKPKQRARHGSRHGRSFSWTPKDTMLFELQLRLVALKSSLPYWVNGPVGIACYFVLPRSNQLAEDESRPGYLWCVEQPDRDNLEKSVLDALNQVVVRDDEQFCFGAQWKMHGPIGSEPSLMIYVFPLEDAVLGTRLHHAKLLAETINEVQKANEAVQRKQKKKLAKAALAEIERSRKKSDKKKK